VREANPLKQGLKHGNRLSGGNGLSGERSESTKTRIETLPEMRDRSATDP